jgi:iron(III) transport system substrate-binding protein
MKRILWVIPVILVVSALYMVSRSSSEQEIVLYSGRSKALVDPLIERFELETGIKVMVRYGGTTQLAVAMMEEGSRTPADLFWAQDAGALGAVASAGLLQKIPSELIEGIPDRYKNRDGDWVATSGRARVIAYSTARVDTLTLPSSVLDLTNPVWRNRLAWAPTNASFQSFVTAMRTIHGDEITRNWLVGIRDNGAKNYANNNAILQGIAAGEADLGITNHYYLYRAKNGDPSFPVAQRFFADGDVGNMINAAGIGITNNSINTEAAHRFITFLLSQEIQAWFVSDVFEYPVIDMGTSDIGKTTLDGISPEIDMETLADLEQTLTLLREVGLL